MFTDTCAATSKVGLSTRNTLRGIGVHHPGGTTAARVTLPRVWFNCRRKLLMSLVNGAGGNANGLQAQKPKPAYDYGRDSKRPLPR